MTLQVGGHHAHHGAHPYREAYLQELLTVLPACLATPTHSIPFAAAVKKIWHDDSTLPCPVPWVVT